MRLYDMIEDRSVDDGERAWGALLVVGRSPFWPAGL